MLRTATDLLKYRLGARDGSTGTVADMLLDQESWRLRYLVVQAARWGLARGVLVPLESVTAVLESQGMVQVHATVDELCRSPSVDASKPVSRESELLLLKYWQWVPRWREDSIPGNLSNSIRVETTEEGRAAIERIAESRLRSVKEVLGYHVRTADGEIGHLDDLVIDETRWLVCYAIIDTRNWLPGKRVLLPTCRIKTVSWAGRAIEVDTTREAIRHAPPYHDLAEITGAYEQGVREHYACKAEPPD